MGFFSSLFVSSESVKASAQELIEGDYKYTSRKVVFARTELSKHLQMSSK